MNSLIIHMTGDTRRAPNVAHLLGTLPGAEIVDAVRGADMADKIPTAPGTHFAPPYPFPLSPGEVGCFLSHRACWQLIMDRGMDYALVVEDDFAAAAPFWEDALRLIETHAGPGSFIRLPAKLRERPGRTLAQAGQTRLFVPRVPGLQTVAQVVGRDAARRLLAASAVIDRPVDTFLQMHWAHGQEIHTILPNGVSELTAELGGSTIQRKTRAGGKLAREWKRAFYRARVALRPQKA
jgi:GR25 family glycosyltransferase involved in LPS biosynthesis